VLFYEQGKGYSYLYRRNAAGRTAIPTFYMVHKFPNGVRFDGGSILDIAPAIAKLMGIAPAPEWEGNPVL
ncbi:MAG: hypothetical protein ACLRVT_06100, partial [Oscillospiraceae bacterium]